jgi:hypothetical protein
MKGWAKGWKAGWARRWRKKAPATDRIGELLVEGGALTSAQLAQAVEEQNRGDPRPLCMLLLEQGIVSQHQIDLALVRQQARRGRLSHHEGIEALDAAHESTQSAGSSLDELVSAAADLGQQGTDEDENENENEKEP